MRRRWRRRRRSRRSSGPGAAPRRPWLGASRGGGGRAVTGLAMFCSPVRKPTPHTAPPRVCSGGEEELEEGPSSAPAPRLSPSEEAATRGGLGMACVARGGWPGRRPRPPEGGTGSGSAAAGLGPDPRRGGGGVRPGRPFRTRWGRAHGDEGCEALPGSVRGDAR